MYWKMTFVHEESENDTDNNYRSCGKRSVQHNKRFGEGEKKMSRLIDADKLKKDIQFVLDTLGEPTKYGLRQAMSIIDKTPTVDAVSRGVVDQIRWERDTALSQLEEIGISLGYPMDDVQKIRHGHWIPVNPDVYGAEYFECSVCGMYSRDGLFRKELDYEYCPNCGAKMDEEKK